MPDLTPCPRDELRKLAERGQLVRCVHWMTTGGHSHVPINPSVLGLLDQLDAAEAKLYAAEEKLGEIVAERDALRAHVHELRTELKGAEAQRQRLIQKEAEA